MRISGLVGVAIAMVAFASPELDAGRLPGDTITNQKGTTLQYSVYNNILALERRRAPGCHLPRVAQTEIVGDPRRLNGGRLMQWNERWTMDRCGSNSIYYIYFDFRGSVGHYKITPPKS